jgi:nucleotide-binding universal stress UspA family protein
LDGAIRIVAVPLDGSEMAETVLPHVERLASLLSLEILLLRVVRMVPWVYGAHERVPLDTTEIEEALELEARKYLNAIESRLKAKGIECQSEVMHRVPWDKIVNFSGKSHDTMVAISTHGRSGIARLVLGSVADMLIRSMETPVLVVRPL